jgi:hypothetical protein
MQEAENPNFHQKAIAVAKKELSSDAPSNAVVRCLVTSVTSRAIQTPCLVNQDRPCREALSKSNKR